MRKVALLILFYYSFSISGTAAQIHFCEGEFQNISFGINKVTNGCCDGSSTCKKCCDSELVRPSLSSHFSSKLQVVHPFGGFAISVKYLFTYFEASQFTRGEVFAKEDLKVENVPVFIKNCTYRL